MIFTCCCRPAAPALRDWDPPHRRVFGLLQNGRVDEAFLLHLLPLLPPGDSELYSHPSLTDFRPEFEALSARGCEKKKKKKKKKKKTEKDEIERRRGGVKNQNGIRYSGDSGVMIYG